MDQSQRINWPSSSDRARNAKEEWKKNQAAASSQRLEEPEPELCGDEGNDALSQLRFPADCWNIRGMFCATPDQFVKDNGFVMNNWVMLSKLAPESQVSEDGVKFKVKFVKKWCYKISVDEFEDLLTKGPYLLREMKSNFGSPEDIVNGTRQSYNYDLRLDDEPTPPLVTSPSRSNESGASSHSSGSTFKGTFCRSFGQHVLLSAIDNFVAIVLH